MRAALARVLPFALVAAWSSGAHGIDPGTAKGTLHVANEAIALTHAYAHVHDNVERVLDRPAEMRILVVDRAMKQEALQGLVTLPVMTLAREGQVRGLLLRFRPDDHANVQVTLLYPPGSLPAWAPLPSRMERGVIRNFKIGDNRVVGAIEDPTRQSHRRDMPPITYAVTFGAPIFHEPKVTQDLKGQAARTSPQLEAIRTSSDSALATSVDAVQRVVVRGNRAVAIFRDKSWRTLERIGAEWRVAE